jgi:hypothetical protein
MYYLGYHLENNKTESFFNGILIAIAVRKIFFLFVNKKVPLIIYEFLQCAATKPSVYFGDLLNWLDIFALGGLIGIGCYVLAEVESGNKYRILFVMVFIFQNMQFYQHLKGFDAVRRLTGKIFGIIIFF